MTRSKKGFPATRFANWVEHLSGWLFTILAISLVAPCRFDLLNKLANLRGTGPKPAKEADDKKKK